MSLAQRVGQELYKIINGLTNIVYDNTASGLAATTVKGAIDEVGGKVDTKVSKVTSTDNAITRFDGTTGQVQDSGVVIDDSGNVGIGATPSAWGSSIKAQQIGSGGAFGADVYNTTYVLANGYNDGVWKYREAREAGMYAIDNNIHYWKNSTAGAVGDPITWTTAMTLRENGNILVGTTTDDGVNKLQVAGSVAVTGTVDGRDVSVDGTKLDTITVGATQLSWTPSYTNTITWDGSKQFTKTSGITGWDAQVYSQSGFSGDCYVTFTAVTSNDIMVGLNSDPTLDVSFTSIDYAIYLTLTGVTIYENGVVKGNFGTHVAGDVFTVRRVNDVVTYYKNGGLLYTSLTSSTARLFLDSSFDKVGDSVIIEDFTSMMSDATTLDSYTLDQTGVPLLKGFKSDGRHSEYTGDLNAILWNSEYNCQDTSVTNNPPFSWFFLKTMMHSGSSAYGRQIAYDMYNSDSRVFMRSRKLDIWEAWTEVQAGTLTGLTSTITELNYCDGVTSNIQTQLNTLNSTTLKRNSIMATNTASGIFGTTWGTVLETTASGGITPTSTSSKILIMTSFNLVSNAAGIPAMRLMANVNNTGWVLLGGTGTVEEDASQGGMLQTDANSHGLISFQYLHSPATTATVQYRVDVRNVGAGSCYFNRTVNSISGLFTDNIATLIAMEA